MCLCLLDTKNLIMINTFKKLKILVALYLGICFLNCTLRFNMFFLFTDCIKMLCSFMEKPNKWHWIKIILRISILKFKKKQPIYLCCINVYMDNDVFFFVYFNEKNHLPDDVCIRDIYLCYQHVFTSTFFLSYFFF